MENDAAFAAGRFIGLVMFLGPIMVFAVGVALIAAVFWIWHWTKRTAEQVGEARLQLAESNRLLRIIAGPLAEQGHAQAARELSLLQEETDPEVVTLKPEWTVKK
jgi:hypothetical protein